MLKILLIWCLAFFATPDQIFSQDIYHCQEFDLNDHVLTNQVCYLSSFKKTKKKYILTVETDSITMRLGILRSFPIFNRKDTDPYHGKGSLTGSLSFAIILGQPDQLYVVREEIREIKFERYYFFSIIPIQQNERLNRPIKGHVLQVSNQPICELTSH